MTTSEAEIRPNEEESLRSSLRIWPTPRRSSIMLPPSSPSDSSDSSIGSSASLSLNEEFPPTFSPTTTLRLINGVPFSWEQIPGMPKRQASIKKEPSGRRLLPLPPAGNSNSRKLEVSPNKYQTSNRTLKRDPFFAALVACSKDEHDHETYFGSIWKGRSKISRSLSDGFGFMNIHSSCKSSCAISESIVYLPKSSPYSYNLLTRHSR
ncbi:uncharacterized protein LOC142523983 [Primulina tabacum]|uniref:uncharacterized protein LOC142523983 n=1 Tax=Primulina tabacum TaxID=48773 RepID=UPI003F5A199C